MRQTRYKNSRGIKAGLVLAAGISARMGAPKALLKICGVTLLEDQVMRLLDLGLKPIVVVVGAHAEKIKKAHKNLKVAWAINPNWKLGIFSSIQRGLKELPIKVTGCIMLPIDTPKITPEVFEYLIDTAEKNCKAAAIIPTYKKRGGHPVWLSRVLIEKLVAAPEDSRLDQILRRTKGVFRLPMCIPDILRNINTPKEWKAFLKTL